MPKTLHNPSVDSTIDTIVEGVNYVIEPGETKPNIPDSHALDLVKRYEFLEQVEEGSEFEDDEEAEETETEDADETDEGEEEAGADTNTAPAPAAKPAAKKTAAKKPAAKKGKK